MPIDLTDFTKIPRKIYYPEEKPVSKIPSYTKNRMAPIDSSLVDSEMEESLTRESRQSPSFRKTHWSVNDFEGVPYNEDAAARIRKERGMKEPDEMPTERLD